MGRQDTKGQSSKGDTSSPGTSAASTQEDTTAEPVLNEMANPILENENVAECSGDELKTKDSLKTILNESRIFTMGTLRILDEKSVLAQVKVSHYDTVVLKKRMHCYNYVMRIDEKLKIVSQDGPLEVDPKKDNVPAQISKNGVDSIAFVQGIGQKSFLEHRRNGLIVSQISTEKLHGKVRMDRNIGTLSWNSSDTQFIYAAESVCPLDKYQYLDSFGELYPDTKEISIFCYCLITFKITRLFQPQHYAEFTPMHCNFARDDLVCFTGYPNKPFKLGHVYMFNRSSFIGLLEPSTGTLVAKITHTPSGLNSLRYPVACGMKGNDICFLANSAGGAHCKYSSIVKYSIGERKFQELTEPIDCKMLQQSWFLDADSERELLVFGSLSVDKLKPMVSQLNCRTGDIELVGEFGRVLDVRGGAILMVRSSLISFPSLALFWNGKVYDQESSRASVEDVEKKIVSFPSYPSIKSLLLLPKDQQKPLIVMTHGGPHSSIPDTFSIWSNTFLSEGFGILLINYPEQDLVGHIGRDEVEFVKEAILSLNLGRKAIYMGGSHAGFVGAWLTVRYPDLFSHIILRNPVINLVSQCSISDIPDWCFEECGLSYQYGPLDLDQIKILYDASPLFHPLYALPSPNQFPKTLLMLGGRDRRVPPAQGIEWYHWLLSKDAKVECVVYPEDGHSLDSFEAVTFGYQKIMDFVEN